MKYVWIVCIVLAFILGCNEEQKTNTPPNIRPLDQHLTPTRQDWKDAYGDNLEAQLVYNFMILRSNDMVIAGVMNKMHPADVNDPNNLKVRAEILEDKVDRLERRLNAVGYIPELYDSVHTRDDVHDRVKRLIREVNKLRGEDVLLGPKEGQVRWIPKTYKKKGYLELYDGKEWITTD